jgi:hypothetical protein
MSYTKSIEPKVPKRTNEVLNNSSSSEDSPVRQPSKASKVEMGLTKEDLQELRNDLKEDLKQELSRHLQPLATKVLKLESAVERVEKTLRANNILIYGLKQGRSESITDLVSAADTLWTKLGLVEKIQIDNIYRLGRQNNDGTPRPVLVKLVRNLDKKVIMAKKNNLIKEKIFISDDLTPMEQFQKRLLQTHLRAIKASDPDLRGTIRGNSLHVKKNDITINQYRIVDGIVEEGRPNKA